MFVSFRLSPLKSSYYFPFVTVPGAVLRVSGETIDWWGEDTPFSVVFVGWKLNCFE
jgi:hypothetical protein